MAQVDYYNTQLKDLLTNPTGSPGFQFGLDSGLNAINRSNSRMRGSGGALAALTKFGTGYALQDWGNQVDRMGRLLGQEQGYDLGQGNLKLGNDKLAWDKEYGTGQLTNQKLGLDNAKLANDQQYGLGMYKAGNDFALGSEQNANTSQNNWWNYLLGQGQNNNTAANNENNFNTNQFKNWIDWFNSQSQNFYKGETNDLAWQKGGF